MSSLTVVVRVLFEADQRWPNSIKDFRFDNKTLVVNFDTKIGIITMTFVEKDYNYHISDVQLTPRSEQSEK